ncbi:MAG TPA: hypothetical protein ENJ09_02530 [Planctomycetes bacterium]|nr:hypothetical protein [Planctomycetota bacterium]
MTYTIAPEVRALLEVALADDSTTLHHLASLPVRRAYEEPLSAGAPFLSKEERHLLRHHREEVAFLLYQGCLLTLQGPVEKTRTILQGEPVEETDWRRRSTLAASARGVHWPEERKWLLDTPRGGLGSEAARIALRLSPSDDVRHVLASLCCIEGQIQESLDVAGELAHRSPSPGHRAAAWTVVGTCHHIVGDHASSLEHNRTAARIDERVLPAAANWFLQSLLVGNVDQALAAAEQLSELEEALAPIRERYLLAIQADRNAAHWNLPHPMKERVRNERLGTVARSLFDALV